MLLNCHTYYSLKYGTLSLERLLQLARDLGYDSLALTDINNTSACLDFARQAPGYGIRAVVGIDFRKGVQQQFVGLARNNKGFEELNQLLTKRLLQEDQQVDEAPSLDHCYVIYPWKRELNRKLAENEWWGVRPGDLSRLRLKHIDTSKMVILATVSFDGKKAFNAHRLLRAIDKNLLLSRLSVQEQGGESDRMYSHAQLMEWFVAYPEIVDNTMRLMGDCSIYFGFGSRRVGQNPKTYTGSVAEDRQLIHGLIKEGLPYRYPQLTAEIEQRIQKELEIIEQKGFMSYFLMNWDILKYARSKQYYYVGRGSGANSVVAYLLRITDVDPIDLDLYFERFINLYRSSPPDFDIDFSWRDRDDVTQYIFNRFDHVALMGTYNTLQYRAIVRELGKVFGLPKHELDKLSSGNFHYNELDHLGQLVFKYAEVLRGVPSHLSVHASGIVITEKPIHHFSATFMPPKGFPTTQFDMVIAEDVGICKFDILSQRGLGKVKEAVEIVARNRPDDDSIDIHDIVRFKKDERIKALLRNAKAIGCFYVESPAMRMLLKKLQVDDYLALVAASSVIRPGVAQSGMMREFILRYRYPERRKDAHPVLLDLMPDTYGVMVYQEDVIKVAHYFAGLDLGQADLLRRGMSGKFRSRAEFAKVQQQFFANCKSLGRPDDLTRDVWRQIESFAGYAFAKGHSASYAVESYQSLYLKAYYPLEYMVATINNFGGFYRTEIYVHEARMHGADIQAPCVNEGSYMTTIQESVIYLGWILVNGFEAKTAHDILQARSTAGSFLDFDDFLNRVPISIEQLNLLIRIDAFRFTELDKRTLLWEAHFKLGKSAKRKVDQDLFKVGVKTFKVPNLSHSYLESAFDQLELLGFSLHSPFDVLHDALDDGILVKDLPQHKGKVICMHAYHVSTKNTATQRKEAMQFGTFLDREGQFLDTVHFPQVAAKYRFRGRGVYEIKGKVVEEFGCYSLEVISMMKLPVIADPRYDPESGGRQKLAS